MSEGNKKIKTRNTQTWPLIYGIVIIGFSAILLALRAVIPFIIFLVIGVSLIVIWIYINQNLQKKEKSNVKDICICPICSHEQTNDCLQNRCPCCIIMKDNDIEGHSNNPLQ